MFLIKKHPILFNNLSKISIKGLYFYVTLFFLFCLNIYLQAQNDLPKFYSAYHTSEPINIDGKSDDKAWNKTAWTNTFIDIEGIKIPKFKTRVKMLWDETYFYFYAELEEPHIWGDITERDAVIFYNNDFEIFLDPDGDTHNYMEFEINALNTVWDLFLTLPYRYGTKVLDNWNINGAKSAIEIDGTLNNASDIDKKWNIEIALPWDVLVEGANSDDVPAGKTWRVNFSRVNWDFDLNNGKYSRKKDPETNKHLPEYNWVWSPQGIIDLHRPEKWGAVYFSKNEVGTIDNFTLGPDELIRVQLFKLHNEQREYIQSQKSWKNHSFPESINIENTEIPLIIEVTTHTYHLQLKSPFSNKIYTINELGKLTSNQP